MMLTFFVVWFLYVNLKIYYNNFELDKKLKKELIIVTILGFLTQYNFCFYAAFLALTMICIALYKKKKEFIKKYILSFVIAAVIGVAIFPSSIYHIFFSYRGIGGRPRTFTYPEAFIGFIKNLFKMFSIPQKFGIIFGIVIIIVGIWKFIKTKSKGLYLILSVPTILTFLAVCKISPYRSARYIMFLFPIISVYFVVLMDDLIDNKKFSEVLLCVLAIYISYFGLATNSVKYLYIGYHNYTDYAEKYKNDRYVYVCTTDFTHIQDLPEFKIYKDTLIIDPDKLNDLKDFNEFENEDEIILGVKNWVDKPVQKVLDEVMENTDFDRYELLYTSNKSANVTLYRLYR